LTCWESSLLPNHIHHHQSIYQSINKLYQPINPITKSFTMKFSQVAILAAASFVAAQETTTTGGGLVSSITAAPSMTLH
jgi:hypothetical protein